jgi:hypothetical protein
MLPYPTPPSRRERELSAEAHATGSRVERDTRDVIVGRNAEWQSCRQIDHTPRVVYGLDRDIYYIPFSTERGCLCRNTLSGLRGTRRRNGARLNFPPLVIIRGFGEQIPETLCGCPNHRDGTSAKCHCWILFLCSPIPEPLAGETGRTDRSGDLTTLRRFFAFSRSASAMAIFRQVTGSGIELRPRAMLT